MAPKRRVVDPRLGERRRAALVPVDRAASTVAAVVPPAPDADEAEFSAYERVAGWSANTRRAYLRAWRAWEAWATAHGAPVLPARGQDVRAYLLERAAEGRALATLRADAGGIAAVHNAAHEPNPCAKGGAVRMALTQLAKQRGSAQR